MINLGGTLVVLAGGLIIGTLYHSRMALDPSDSGRLPVMCTCGFVPQGKLRLADHLREWARIGKKITVQHRCSLRECVWCGPW